jgi:CRP-like cAMP-binding protein
MALTRRSEQAEQLGSIGVFAGLDRVALAKLAAHLEPVRVPDGATLVRQGDPADCLYLICRGRFGVFGATPGGDERVRLGTLTRGDPVGEMGLLTGEARSATVRAEGDGEVLRLDRAHFLRLAARDPSVPLATAVTLSRRLRAADAALVGAPTDRLPPPAAPIDTATTGDPSGVLAARRRQARRSRRDGGWAGRRSAWRWPASRWRSAGPRRPRPT